MVPQQGPDPIAWAKELRLGVPEALRLSDAQMALERVIYRDRRDAVSWLYRAFMRLAPNVPVKRLRRAVSGDERYGRVPLAFSSVAAYAKFRAGLQRIFRASGIRDATVQAIGSAMYGWRANPRKSLGAWVPGSDLDLAVFSVQALEQAQQLQVPVNDKVMLNNEYVVLKNRLDSRKCFYNTPVGIRLGDFALEWSDRLGLEVDFKLNLRVKPFDTAATLIRPEDL